MFGATRKEKIDYSSDDTTSTPVAAIMPIIVAHEIIFPIGLFVCSPMIFLLFMISMTKIRIIGSNIPFTSCERIMIFTSGTCGIKTINEGRMIEVRIIP